MITTRITKYRQPLINTVRMYDHVTNAEILRALKPIFPELSATTIHRITSRMVERQELRIAPATNDNAMRFDTNLTPHDHFHCIRCDRLKDVIVPREFLKSMQAQLGNCKLSGNITVQGQCSSCLTHEIGSEV